MEREGVEKVLGDLLKEKAGEIAFALPVRAGEVTIIPAATVTCLTASKGNATVALARCVPCAAIVLRGNECSLLSLPSPTSLDKLVDLAPRLLDLLERGAEPGSPGKKEDPASAGSSTGIRDAGPTLTAPGAATCP